MWRGAPYRARICHAGCGVCAPAARGRESRAEERRHAPSRRLRHRPRAHHRLLPRHRQRQRMLHVPERYQQGCTLRNNRALWAKKNWGERKNRLSPLFFYLLSSSLSRCLSHRIIIRQIRLSASYLHDMTFSACGASLVFVIRPISIATLQTPRACPLRKPPRWMRHRYVLSAWLPTFVRFLRFYPGSKIAKN